MSSLWPYLQKVSFGTSHQLSLLFEGWAQFLNLNSVICKWSKCCYRTWPAGIKVTVTVQVMIKKLCFQRPSVKWIRIFLQFAWDRIAAFKMLNFPSNCSYFSKWVGLNGIQKLIPPNYDENEKSIISRLKGCSYSNLDEIWQSVQDQRSRIKDSLWISKDAPSYIIKNLEAPNRNVCLTFLKMRMNPFSILSLNSTSWPVTIAFRKMIALTF